ncbi:MAG: nucleotidyltransferase domain-containing protein [bacterium]|nr:nucleotidyltransferase domain-containing protein [bacterium]
MGVRPSKVILFGSHARGEAGAVSDIDLLVVSPDWDGMGLRARLETLGVAAARIWEPVEALACTPQELQQVRPATFLEEILRTGVIVWEEESAASEGADSERLLGASEEGHPRCHAEQSEASP